MRKEFEMMAIEEREDFIVRYADVVGNIGKLVPRFQFYCDVLNGEDFNHYTKVARIASMIRADETASIIERNQLGYKICSQIGYLNNKAREETGLGILPHFFDYQNVKIRQKDISEMTEMLNAFLEFDPMVDLILRSVSEVRRDV